MAKRRMLATSIVCSWRFMALPPEAQALYYQINFNADDDGFCDNVMMLVLGLQIDTSNIQVLIDKGYLLQFDDDVVVVTHWKIHNTIRKDRYTSTIHKKELAMLALDENDTYCLYSTFGNQMATKWQPNGNQMTTQSKESKEKVNLIQYRVDYPTEPIPTLTQQSVDKKDNKEVLELNDIKPDTVVEMFNNTCKSYPEAKLNKTTTKRIAELTKEYTLGEIQEAFNLIEQSEFLKGNKGFKACFGWLIRLDNIDKVLKRQYTAANNRFNDIEEHDRDYTDIDKKLLQTRR